MASLAFHRNLKRNRPDHDLDSDLVDEPFLTNDSWPRFVVLSSASEEKPLSKLSPFAVQKGFQAIAGTLESTKKPRDGSFRMECSRRTQAENLLKTVTFVGPCHCHSSSLSCSCVHTTLNSSRGVIRCRELSDLSEVEIRDELKTCLLYTSPSPRDYHKSRMPSSA